MKGEHHESLRQSPVNWKAALERRDSAPEEHPKRQVYCDSNHTVLIGR